MLFKYVSEILGHTEKAAHVSSLVISLVLWWFLSPPGSGGGDDDAPGELDFRRDDRLELCREGVLYGVSVGVGREARAAAAYSSSVSHTVMVTDEAYPHLSIKCPAFTVMVTFEDLGDASHRIVVYNHDAGLENARFYLV